jgi:hypothetical protein
MSSNSRHILGIGTEVKLTSNGDLIDPDAEPQIVKVTGITRTHVNFSNGVSISHKEIEFALDAFGG